jgi:ComF family protein
MAIPRALTSLTRHARSCGARLADLVLPPRCLACFVEAGSHGGLCAPCWAGLPLIERPFCERLGLPFAYDHGEGMLSAQAIAQPPAFGRSRSAARYEGIAVDLVHRLKFGDRVDIAPLMGRLMARAGADILGTADLIVPVPLHRLRLWRRRFNQAAVLTRALSHASGRPWRGDLLVRRRRTASQVGLDPDARRKNVRGAFAVEAGHGQAVDGKSVLLVDDVRTTGATAAACVQALRASGARTVTLLTFALVPASARLHI